MRNTACMYLRLSREDGDSNESNSISNQRQLIKSYAKEKNIDLSFEYVDDGYSGSNFERPNFKNMIDDLNKGKFSIIMVKDLSRFGRDYIESGKYLQKIFPEKGIRFISVNDNYDSDNSDVSDTHLILPIRNFINDSYCRDISMKVKSSKEVKRKNGEFIGSFASFGYKKDDKNKYQLVVDTEVAHIIERIFNMKIEGYSSKAIAGFLNSIGTVTPSKHKENNGDNFNTGFVVKKAKWDAKMVNRIISNKVYIGVLEQGKTTKLNYKSKHEVDVSKEDWIAIENAHESIVSKSMVYVTRQVMPAKGIVLVDTGALKMWMARLYPTYEPNTCLIDNGLSTMSWTLPGAIGAKLAVPDQPVLAVMGDGSFMMNSQEIETAVREKIPMTILIWTDKAYGLIKWKMDLELGHHSEVNFSNPDFVKYAESFGAIGHLATSRDDLKDSLEKALSDEEHVNVIIAPVDYEENNKLLQKLGDLTISL